MKAYWGNGGCLYVFLTWALDRSGQPYTQAALNLGKDPLYPLDTRPRGPHSRFECSDEEKNNPAHAGNRTPVLEPAAINYINWAILAPFLLASK
jgi:hypothetical protein